MKNSKALKGVKEVRRVEDNRIDEVIGEIFKIESAALGIQSDTEREKEDYAAMIEHKIKEFDEQLAEETKEKIQNLKRQLKADKEKELLAMRNDISGYTSKLDVLYEANHEEWVRNIVESIIKE